MDSTELPHVPRYGTRSLPGVLPSLLAALGVPDVAGPLHVPPVRSACVLLLDGLGWELLAGHAAEAPFLTGMAQDTTPLDAGFPGDHRDEAVAAGWFGPSVLPGVLPRIGDVVVAARDRHGVVLSATEPKETAMIGHHGSLTPAEQRVPFLLSSAWES